MKTNLTYLKKYVKEQFGKYAKFVEISICDKDAFNDNDEFCGYEIDIQGRPYSNYMTESDAISTILGFSQGMKFGLEMASKER